MKIADMAGQGLHKPPCLQEIMPLQAQRLLEPEQIVHSTIDLLIFTSERGESVPICFGLRSVFRTPPIG